MAEDMGERTEKPTAKRLSDARRRGDVAKSQELTAAVGLTAAIILLVTLGGGVVRSMKQLLERSLAGEAAGEAFDPRAARDAIAWSFGEGATTVLPFMGLILAVTLLSQYLQVGWNFTTKPLRPKWSKLNPASGVKKIFGTRNLVRSSVNTIKLALVVVVAWLVMQSVMASVVATPRLEAAQGVYLILTLALQLAIWLLAVLLILAIIDFIYQRWQHTRDLRMTKHEVKDERRSMEGDPQVKRKRMQMAMQIAMQRIQHAVPKADVIITNPTHFAVALAYDQASMRAPRVVAKGADLLAMRIRQLAAANAVPIVERPALARALYWGVDVGREIPAEHYEAVAEILAYVYRTEAVAAA